MTLVEQILLYIIVLGVLGFVASLIFPPLGVVVVGVGVLGGIFSLFTEYGVWKYIFKGTVLLIPLIILFWVYHLFSSVRFDVKNSAVTGVPLETKTFRIGAVLGKGVFLAFMLFLELSMSAMPGVEVTLPPVLEFYGNLPVMRGIVIFLISGVAAAIPVQLLEGVIRKAAVKRAIEKEAKKANK